MKRLVEVIIREKKDDDSDDGSGGDERHLGTRRDRSYIPRYQIDTLSRIVLSVRVDILKYNFTCLLSTNIIFSKTKGAGQFSGSGKRVLIPHMRTILYCCLESEY